MKYFTKMSVMIVITALCVCFTALICPAAGPDIEIVEYDVSDPNILEGEAFTLTLDLTNNSGEDLSDLCLELGNSSFYFYNQGSNVSITPLFAADSEQQLSLRMVYSGDGSGRIPLVFSYSKGGLECSLEQIVGVRVGTINDIYDPEEETQDSSSPVLALVDKEVIDAKAGEALSIKLQVKNMSSASARNVLISASPSDTENSPILFSGKQSFDIGSLGSGSRKAITMDCYVEPWAQAGMYSFTMGFQFCNEAGNTFTSTESVYVRIVQGNPPPRFVFTPQLEAGVNPGAGEPYNLNISMKNTGKIMAKDVQVSLDGLAVDGIALDYGTNRRYVAMMTAGEERFINYVIKPSSEIKKGSHPLTIRVSYLDVAGKEYSDEQIIYIPVGSSNVGGKGIPKIIISNYNSSPVLVQAGQTFNLTMTFLNTHSGKTVHNIKVILTITEGSNETGNVFTPVNASNTFYIESIAPRGTVTQFLSMYTIPDAEPKTYSITAELEYEDADGTEIKSTEIIGIPVVQNSQLDVSDLEFPPEAYAGQPLPVSCEFYNTGRSKIRNLLVKLEGDFDKENGSVYIGNMDAGSSDYFDATIIPMNPGETKGTVVFTFEDANGELAEIRKEFTLNVMEQAPMEPFPEDMAQPPATGIWAKKWLLAIPVVLVVAVTVWIIRRRKKKKMEEMMFDD